ncbi:hypothetical protein KPSA1_03609 [Pseudomonas syringae pv. actinidiae]|uniref:Uncharacterized protein n=1 Tax=Pseudomonas syringae pv. actinidiae TaxID=103796 RepID=A0A2V0QC22_PSESF|nr:hypothetical protein KPSA1_03609 [Pseudomonas syringae pv. actinidiae]
MAVKKRSRYIALSHISFVRQGPLHEARTYQSTYRPDG